MNRFALGLAMSTLVIISCKERTFGESSIASRNSAVRKVEFRTQAINGKIRTVNGLKISVAEAFLECFFSDGSGAVQRKPITDLTFELKELSLSELNNDHFYEINLGPGAVKYSAIFSELVSCRYVLHVNKEGDNSVGADVDVLKLPAIEVGKFSDVTERVSARFKPLTLSEINGVILKNDKI